MKYKIFTVTVGQGGEKYFSEKCKLVLSFSVHVGCLKQKVSQVRIFLFSVLKFHFYSSQYNIMAELIK